MKKLIVVFLMCGFFVNAAQRAPRTRSFPHRYAEISVVNNVVFIPLGPMDSRATELPKLTPSPKKVDKVAELRCLHFTKVYRFCYHQDCSCVPSCWTAESLLIKNLFFHKLKCSRCKILNERKNNVLIAVL